MMMSPEFALRASHDPSFETEETLRMTKFQYHLRSDVEQRTRTDTQRGGNSSQRRSNRRVGKFSHRILLHKRENSDLT